MANKLTTVEEFLTEIAIINDRIYRINGMRDITDVYQTQINGRMYNTRRVAFFILNGRWPSHNFLLPWETHQ